MWDEGKQGIKKCLGKMKAEVWKKRSKRWRKNELA